MTAPAPAAPASAPYIDVHPGDLILAENFNQMQVMIKQDIATQVAAGMKSVNNVDEAKNAETLDNQSLDQLTKNIIAEVLQAIPPQGGYMRTFLALDVGKEKLIPHKLNAFPLVDVYQLDYFLAVWSSEDGPDKEVRNVNFFLYHSSEKRIKNPNPTDKTTPPTIVIEDASAPHLFRLSFAQLLVELGISYEPTTSIAELVTTFWRKLLGNEFTEDQYCHSPWFDRCCGENRPISQIKAEGDWPELWLKVQPRKTINFPRFDAFWAVSVPPNIEVSQYDYSTVGIRTVATPGQQDTAAQGPLYPRTATDDFTVAVTDTPPTTLAKSSLPNSLSSLVGLVPPPAVPDQLKVMVLLFAPVPIPAPAK